MKIIKTNCTGELSYSFPCPKEKLLFFDIETTGFSAKTSALYLIGVLFYKNNSWNTMQWFADDYKSEKNLLTSFFSFMKSFTCLVHFNGNTFDIPFLEKKCAQHKLSTEKYNFSSIQSIDLYKLIYPHRKRLDTENLKQKTLEKFMRTERTDLYTGKELIAFYQKYHQALLKGDTQDALEIEKLLLLHNHDDLTGMLQFSNILFLTDLLNGTISFENIKGFLKDNMFMIRTSLPFSLENFFWTGTDAALFIEGNTLTVLIFILDTELKYFYSDYKNYYYLPIEDTAIHKSISSYVDKKYREPAKKTNCYIKKTGKYIPVFTNNIAPIFKKDFHDKTAYIALDEAFFTNADQLCSYVKSFLKNNDAILLQPYTD